VAHPIFHLGRRPGGEPAVAGPADHVVAIVRHTVHAIGRAATPIEVAFDGVPSAAPRHQWPKSRDGFFTVPDRLERVPRHSSCLHALLDRPGLDDPLDLRFFDTSRRFVPRRLSIAMSPKPVRIRPGLFPGAAYDVAERSTGLRGRVLRGPPTNRRVARWCRVIARVGTRVVGRAHGDDRGEFLLLLQPDAGTIGTLSSPIAVEVTVYARLAEPAPSSPDLPGLDPYWDLPLEPVPALTNDVTRGLTLPASYVETATSVRTVNFPLSLLKSEPPFIFSPT